MEKENNCLEKINELARGSSVQAKASNQYWLALIVVSIASIIPKVEKGMIDLPFNLGEVTPFLFYAICLIILSGLSIAYTNAHIEVSRIKDEIRSVRKKLEKIEKSKPKYRCDHWYLDDIINSSIIPNFNKVASVPLYFFPNKLTNVVLRKRGIFCATLWFFGKSLTYVVFKAVSWVFTYGIPAVAIVTCFRQATTNAVNLSDWEHFLNDSIRVVSIMGLAALAVMLWVDIKWTFSGVGRWCKPYYEKYPWKFRKKKSIETL